jgi:hypothetical protein
MTTIGHHRRLLASFAEPAPHHGIVSARRAVLVAGATVLLIGVLAPSADSYGTTAIAAPDAATASEGELRAAMSMRLHELEAASGAAEGAWRASAERVLDEAARTELYDAIARAESVVAEARQRVVWPGTTLEAAATEDLAAVADAASALDAGVAGVEDAVGAWEAEQARLAAEAEAARQAAEAAAARTALGGRTAPAAAGGMHIEGIWASGGQAEIDACRGAVNVAPVASYLGGAFYAAEHWSCGGSAWGGIGVGALVEFSGYGTYQVAGRIGGLSYGSDASVLPGGYAGYYQTCVGGSSSNMTVWLLTRVG